jgi:hypothetical protein
MEQQGTGELTDGGGVRGSDEEDANEKLGDEHGDAGGSSVWWWVVNWVVEVLERNLSRFYIRSLISCEHEKPQVASAYRLLPGLPVLSLFSFPPSLDVQPVPSHFTRYLLTSLGIRSPIASSIIRGPPLTFALILACIYRSQPRLAPCIHSLSCFIRHILVSLGIQYPVSSSIIRGPSSALPLISEAAWVTPVSNFLPSL